MQILPLELALRDPKPRFRNSNHETRMEMIQKKLSCSFLHGRQTEFCSIRDFSGFSQGWTPCSRLLSEWGHSATCLWHREPLLLCQHLIGNWAPIHTPSLETPVLELHKDPCHSLWKCKILMNQSKVFKKFFIHNISSKWNENDQSNS